MSCICKHKIPANEVVDLLVYLSMWEQHRSPQFEQLSPKSTGSIVNNENDFYLNEFEYYRWQISSPSSGMHFQSGRNQRKHFRLKMLFITSFTCFFIVWYINIFKSSSHLIPQTQTPEVLVREADLAILNKDLLIVGFCPGREFTKYQNRHHVTLALQDRHSDQFFLKRAEVFLPMWVICE